MTQARVFAVTQQEADTAHEDVIGMILVFDRDAHILIDPGATHSFISKGFISNVKVESQPIDCSIVVSLSTSDTPPPPYNVRCANHSTEIPSRYL